MPKTITSSDLHLQVKQVLNEVDCGQNQYVLRGTGRIDLDPSAPALAADKWDAVRGKLLDDSP